MPTIKQDTMPESVETETYDTAVEDAASTLAEKRTSTPEERYALAQAVVDSAEESMAYVIKKMPSMI